VVEWEACRERINQKRRSEPEPMAFFRGNGALVGGQFCVGGGRKSAIRLLCRDAAAKEEGDRACGAPRKAKNSLRVSKFYS